MMQFLWLSVLFLVSLTLESTLLEKIAIEGAKPDFLLVIVIFYALLYGAIPAAKLGFIYGLIEDLATGKFIGINTISKMITGYLVGLGEGKLYSENLLVPVIGLFVGSIIHYSCFFILGLISGFPGVFPVEAFFKTVFISSIYNVCLAPFLYGRYYRLIKSTSKRRVHSKN